MRLSNAAMVVGWPGNEAKQYWWLDGLGMRLSNAGGWMAWE